MNNKGDQKDLLYYSFTYPDNPREIRAFNGSWFP